MGTSPVCHGRGVLGHDCSATQDSVRGQRSAPFRTCPQNPLQGVSVAGCLAHLNSLSGTKANEALEHLHYAARFADSCLEPKGTLAYIIVPPLTREVIENSPFSFLYEQEKR